MSREVDIVTQLLKIHPLAKTNWRDLDRLREQVKLTEIARGPNAEQGKLESTINIPMRDGHKSELRIFRPMNPPEISPLVALLFGGGFCMGSNAQPGCFARGIASLMGATVVSLSYRLAPEHKFPTQIHDALDSVKWLAANAASVGADTSAGFILGGVSAGANLAANVTQASLQDPLSSPVTGTWLSVPFLVNDNNLPQKYKPVYLARQQNAEAPILDADAIEQIKVFMEMDEASPSWSPFNVPGAHTGLPPTYVQVCGMDPVRDDGLIYEAVLREHGVETRLDAYPGVPHAHFSFLPMLGSAKKAQVDVLRGFAWLLKKDVSEEAIASAAQYLPSFLSA